MKAFDNYSAAESFSKSTESGSMAFVKDSDLNQKSNSVPNVKKNPSLKKTGYDPKKNLYLYLKTGSNLIELHSHTFSLRFFMSSRKVGSGVFRPNPDLQ